MLASNIALHEDDFMENHIDSEGKKHIIVMDSSKNFPYAYIWSDSTGYYYKEETKKEIIVLHYTCGFLKGDIATLTEQDSHMSVHFVIARNGIAFQLFDTKFWSYHLGRNALGGNTFNSKRSISI